MTIRSLPGGVPEPDELFGREHLIQCVWDLLAGNKIYLVTPRRFGKTSVMAHILKRPAAGYFPAYLEVEDLHDPEALAAELIVALLEHDNLRKCLNLAKGVPERVTRFVSDHVQKVSMDSFQVELKELMRNAWQDTAKALILEMEKADETVVFILDKLPQFIENLERKHGANGAREFLEWFRSLRMKQKGSLRRFRFILRGSTGIDIILRRPQVSDKLNDCFRVPVEAISREAAESLLRGLAERYQLTFAPEAFAHTLNLISPAIPYFLHLLVSQVILEEKLKNRPLSPQDIDDVYQRRVIGPTARPYFEYYRQRLRRYGAACERAAMAILHEIAQATTGRISQSGLYDAYRRARAKGATGLEFDEIMADLESDWYVVLDPPTNEYYFLLSTMKDWWKRYYRTYRAKRS
jgi:uncharacterized protein